MGVIELTNAIKNLWASAALGFLAVVALLAMPVKAMATWTSLIDPTTLTGITADVTTLQGFIVTFCLALMGVCIVLSVMARLGR